MNSYGEIRLLTLPNSQLKVSYSTKYFRITDAERPLLEPDLEAPLTLEDDIAAATRL